MDCHKVFPAERYFNYLNISPICSDTTAEDQLRTHLICSILASSKQVDRNGNIKTDSVSRSVEEVSAYCLKFHTIGMKATKEDLIEVGKIVGKSEPLFENSVLKDVVEMDENAIRFRPMLPGAFKPLYERILGAHQRAREDERRNVAVKEDEISWMENECRMKTCNFLMELIDRVRHAEEQNYRSPNQHDGPSPFFEMINNGQRSGRRSTVVEDHSSENSDESESRTSVYHTDEENDEDQCNISRSLSYDDKHSLEIIRNFAFLYRNPCTDGFRPLEHVLSLLKIKSADYWIPLIRFHLHEVKIVMCRNMPLLVWRGNGDSD
ncbi:hypothetical protein KIN20_010357 [Parelaphostrongylus tenuis]|uniref:Uncharacterized protein n=1 Tax=Parelaphostrongylus tenuis TaxID=148309 RepID=A0AAD5MCF5_PARTN|nr:hypothetical protein KIN20_010357 [Parelaphostrongylus tenuis]